MADEVIGTRAQEVRDYERECALADAYERRFSRYGDLTMADCVEDEVDGDDD